MSPHSFWESVCDHDNRHVPLLLEDAKFPASELPQSKSSCPQTAPRWPRKLFQGISICGPGALSSSFPMYLLPANQLASTPWYHPGVRILVTLELEEERGSSKEGSQSQVRSFRRDKERETSMLFEVSPSFKESWDCKARRKVKKLIGVIKAINFRD